MFFYTSILLINSPPILKKKKKSKKESSVYYFGQNHIPFSDDITTPPFSHLQGQPQYVQPRRVNDTNATSFRIPEY